MSKSDYMLLGVGSGRDPHGREDRILQEALELPSAERRAFIQNAAQNDPALERSLLELLRAAEESSESAEEGARSSLAAEEKPGVLIDHFRLIRLLGEGGMGCVWEAEQTEPWKRKVALKVIKLGMDTRGVVKRFERERQALALLNHPNIAQVYQAGATGMGRPYFAMELVEGQPITTYCEQNGLERRARLELFQQVCAAVEHAHQKGVIHRDIKPTNVLVSDGRVKIIDFGVAKATQGTSDTLHTREPQILGTPAYMSPEQATTGGLDVDTRTDIYALGVLLYELATGTVPFDPARLARTGLAEMQRILREEDPVRPSVRLERLRAQGQLANHIPSRPLADLDWVVMKAMQKDREDRYQSSAALSEDVGHYLRAEPVSVGPPELAYRARKFFRRHRKSVLAAVLTVLTLITATVISTREAIRANRAENRAAATLTDMYARSGLAAAERNDPALAALWFANAALSASNDPPRRDAHLARAAAWRREISVPLAALPTPFPHLDIEWNPRHPALIIDPRSESPHLLWDLRTDTLWQPPGGATLFRSVWHPSGDLLAGSNGTNILVLAWPSGTEMARLSEAPRAPLKFSPDGSLLAVGGQNAFLWEWRTGTRQNLPDLGLAVESFAFSHDGHLLMMITLHHAAICNTASPAKLLHPKSPNPYPLPAQFLGSGENYFTGDSTGHISVRDTATGRVVETYPGQNGSYPTTASPDGRFLARYNAPVIDRSQKQPATFPVHKNASLHATFSADGKWLASGGADSTVALWQLPEGKLVRHIGVHQNTVRNVTFSPDATLLASAQEGLIRIWRVHPSPASRLIPVEAHSLATVSLDGTLVAPSGLTHRAGALTRTRAYHTATGEPACPEIVPGGIIMDAEFHPAATWLALSVSTTRNRNQAALGSQPGSGEVQLWDFRTGESFGEPLPLPSEPREIAVHPSGRWIAVACHGGEGVEIELATRETRILFTHDRRDEASATLANGRCAYSPDGKLLAVFGYHEYVHLWDRETGRELIPSFQPGANFYSIDFSGPVLAAAVVSPSNHIALLNVTSGEPIARPIPYSNWPLHLRFHPGGNLLLVASRDGAARIWNWREARLHSPALLHVNEVIGGTFLPGHPWVATSGYDGAIKLWDHRNGMLAAPPLLHHTSVLQLQATPDGRTLIAGGLSHPGHPGQAAIELIDLAAWAPSPTIPPQDALALAEIDVAATLHPGGDVVPLMQEEWLQRWRAFRKKHPGLYAESMFPPTSKRTHVPQ